MGWIKPDFNDDSNICSVRLPASAFLSAVTDTLNDLQNNIDPGSKKAFGKEACFQLQVWLKEGTKTGKILSYQPTKQEQEVLVELAAFIRHNSKSKFQFQTNTNRVIPSGPFNPVEKTTQEHEMV
jgi:hypothetical protein